ncbi:peptide deformylase [Apibacter sp. HY039]|uniref:peptide deformylase n=1 Tax=Apibacter sp. HY039 TaxID=2501476 RepID=UPI001C87C5BA|nr:peptide deformylase [Apibacter sp. HY039]
MPLKLYRLRGIFYNKPSEFSIFVLMKLWLPLLILFLFTGCASVFTESEKTLIYQNPESPARLITLKNPSDSLILRRRSVDIKNSRKNKDLPQLVKKLYLTMLAENGVGIAAPQIGINRNIFLFYRLDLPEKSVEVAINPRIVSHSEELFCFRNDGCLSVPDQYGNSRRYAWVEVEYINQNGEKVRNRFNGGSRAEDYTGIIFQHEFDHINGKLYIDRKCNE